MGTDRWVVRYVGQQFGAAAPAASSRAWYAQDSWLGYCTGPDTKAAAERVARGNNREGTL